MCLIERASRNAPLTGIYEGRAACSTSHPDEWRGLRRVANRSAPVEGDLLRRRTYPTSGRNTTRSTSDFFEDLGSPGGASKTGKTGKDHPVVAGAAGWHQRRGMTLREPASRFHLGPDRAAAREKPGSHPDGAVDLSMGTPVDPVARLDPRRAGRGVGRGPGTRRRGARRGCGPRRGGLAGPAPMASRCRRIDVLPVVGTKEFIAWPAGHARPRARRT